MRGLHRVRASQATRLGPSPFPDRQRRPAPRIKPSSAPLAPSAVGTRRSGAGADPPLRWTAARLSQRRLGTLTSEVPRHLVSPADASRPLRRPPHHQGLTPRTPAPPFQGPNVTSSARSSELGVPGCVRSRR